MTLSEAQQKVNELKENGSLKGRRLVECEYRLDRGSVADVKAIEMELFEVEVRQYMTVNNCTINEADKALRLAKGWIKDFN